MTVTLSGIAAGGESEVSAGIAASVDASTLAQFGYARRRLGLSARAARQLVVITTNEWLQVVWHGVDHTAKLKSAPGGRILITTISAVL